MGKFVLSNGEEIVIDGHTGPYVPILIGQKYNKEGYEDIPVDEKWLNTPDKKVEVAGPIMNIEGESFPDAVSTYILAVNPEYKEYETVKEYDGQFSVNTKYRHKIEIILQSEEWRKRFFMEWTGKGSYGVNFFDKIRSLPDEIMGEAQEGKLEEQGIKWVEENKEQPLLVYMYTDDTRHGNIEFDERQLEASIVSVRLIDFQTEIIE